MNKKRIFIVCTLSILCVLLISTKVKANQYTEDAKYIENINILSRQIRDNAVNRNNNFSIFVKITYDKPVDTDKLNNYADKLVEKAMSEEFSNSSSSGDYLKYSWDNYRKSITGFYSYEYYKYTYYLTITYKFNYYTTYSQEQQLNDDISEYIRRYTNKEDTDLQKILKIYNYISSNVKYDKNYSDLKYSAYSAYENKTAICQGYATLLYKMLKEAGVDDVRIIRSSSHSWNIVKIGSKYYHLDTTWEATTNKKGNYNYFLKGSNTINKLSKHKLDSEYCTKKFKKEHPISNQDYMNVKITSLKRINRKKINVKWKKNSYCDGYVIEYSTNKKFKNAKRITVTNKKNKSKSIKNLKINKKYYIRIRTYKIIQNKKNYFSWTNTSIKI